MNTFKTIKPGQLVTVNNVVYRCKKARDLWLWKTCDACDLYQECGHLHFICGPFRNFKQIK